MLLTNASTNGSNSSTIHHRENRNDRVHHGTQANSSPLVLSLSQIHSGGGLSLSQIQGGTNLLILNNPSSSTNSSHPPTSVAMVTNFKCASAATTSTSHQQPPLKQYHHPRNKVILKHESMDPNQLSCCRMTNNSSNGQKMDESNERHTNISNLPAFVNTVFSNGKADVGKNLNSAPVTPTKCMDTSDNSGTEINYLGLVYSFVQEAMQHLFFR